MYVRTFLISASVASLGWVTPGAATEGVTPLFFPEKPGDLFLVASSAVSPLTTFLTTFFAHRFIALYYFHSGISGVTPLEGVTLHLFLPVRPRFSTILGKFAHKKIFLRMSPPWRVSPGAVRPLTP